MPIKMQRKTELETLTDLNETLDQMANPGCGKLCPEVEHLIDLAWWFTEQALRWEKTIGCPDHEEVYKHGCQRCKHFNELTASALHYKAKIRG